MTKTGKVIRVLPNETALFQILIYAGRNGNKVMFRLAPSLNKHVPVSKQSDGIYSFAKHKDVMKWFFHSYKRHISKICMDFLFNHYPEFIENALGVRILPSARVSAKKFSELFYKKYSGHMMEIFPDSDPDESEVNKNFYDIKASINGGVLSNHYFFMVHKTEYAKWKAKYGKSFPFVITKQNHLMVS